jgi:hypothetical protein
MPLKGYTARDASSGELPLAEILNHLTFAPWAEGYDTTSTQDF